MAFHGQNLEILLRPLLITPPAPPQLLELEGQVGATTRRAEALTLGGSLTSETAPSPPFSPTAWANGMLISPITRIATLHNSIHSLY